VVLGNVAEEFEIEGDVLVDELVKVATEVDEVDVRMADEFSSEFTAVEQVSDVEDGEVDELVVESVEETTLEWPELDKRHVEDELDGKLVEDVEVGVVVDVFSTEVNVEEDVEDVEKVELDEGLVDVKDVDVSADVSTEVVTEDVVLVGATVLELLVVVWL
jgi:hypothetical protein